ncbi:PepSY domain-containing protein [Microvirga sp. M2]|uniref:PepSY domain-containing protein n=1 Tax=Microvirga sp. M2 TaxID=3073270 RepID=UPI0039C4A40C
MRTIIAAAILTFGLAAPSLAEERQVACSATDAQAVAPASTVRSSLEDLGYNVGRIETEHGCYEVRAENGSGYPIRALYHAGTGELVQAGLARD